MTHSRHIAIRKGIFREKQCEKVFCYLRSSNRGINVGKWSHGMFLSPSLEVNRLIAYVYPLLPLHDLSELKI